MAIEVPCPGCEAEYRVSDDKAGRRFKCKSCETVVEVPDVAADSGEVLEEEAEVEVASPSTPRRGRGTVSSGRGRPRSPGRSESSTGKLVRRAPSNLGAVLGMAAAVAVVGALVWGAVTYFAHFEIGWIAWGIGAAAGAAAVKAGGFGARDAVIVGVIAVVAILGGKYIGHLGFVKDTLESSRDVFLLEHANLAEAANEIAALAEGDEEERAAVGEINAAAINLLVAGRVATSFPYAPIDLAEAQAQWAAVRRGQSAEDYVTARTESLRRSGELDFTSMAFGGSTRGAVFDIVFIILGFGTAAGMVMKQPAFVRK